jgi:N-acetylglutamate synthase-like GNAT family acetyltransferase
MTTALPSIDHEIALSFDRARLDVDLIHRFLSTDAYWSKGVPRAVVERAIANSLCIGAYRDTRQVGFARLVTDHATFAYLADVFVVAAERGRGVARRMVRSLLDEAGADRMRRVLLFTADAHDLYRDLGFVPLARPERGMEIVKPDLYRDVNPSDR